MKPSQGHLKSGALCCIMTLYTKNLMELTTRQLNIISISLTNFYDEVCKTGTTPEMKQDIMELCKMVNDEYAKSFAKTL